MLRHPQVLPHLLALLEARRGDDDERIRHALALLVEQLAVDTAFVSRFGQGKRHFTHVAGLPLPSLAQVPVAVEETVCRLIATGDLDPLVTDTRTHPTLVDHPHITEFAIGTYAGVPLVVDGDIVGAVCAVASSPRPTLGERDADRLATVGEFIGQVLTRAQRAARAADRAPVDPGPAARPNAAAGPGAGGAVEVPQLAAVVGGSRDLESMTRPLLELLHTNTGLESTYLTFIDWPGDQQRIVHSLNTGELAIPEGLSVPWSDTLCRRSLDAGTPYTRNVPEVWGDSRAARELGIRTYVSVPILDADQAVIGTLCGASSASVDLDGGHLVTMQLFGRVLADQISRERRQEREHARAENLLRRTRELDREVGLDGLTGLRNPLGVHEWLSAVIPTLQPGTEQLAVAFMDVDDFTAVNDAFGRAAGDAVLRQLAGSLAACARTEDLQGRWEADRFVTAAVLPATDASFGNWTHRQRRAATTIYRDAVLVRCSVGAIVVTDPATGPDRALEVAERSMRRRKAQQRAVASP